MGIEAVTLRLAVSKHKTRFAVAQATYNVRPSAVAASAVGESHALVGDARTAWHPMSTVHTTSFGSDKSFKFVSGCRGRGT